MDRWLLIIATLFSQGNVSFNLILIDLTYMNPVGKKVTMNFGVDELQSSAVWRLFFPLATASISFNSFKHLTTNLISCHRNYCPLHRKSVTLEMDSAVEQSRVQFSIKKRVGWIHSVVIFH